MSRSNNRRSSGRFIAIPHNVLNSSDYMTLSAIARSLLIELAYQYNGKNNGDLTLAWKILKSRGFKSESTINRGKKNLLEQRLITEVRKGVAQNGRRLCSLYAINWRSLDESFYPDGTPKHNLPSTRTPLRIDWKKFIS
ncbi:MULTISPECIES: hypothetical protein [unclassified Colwellia]|uniref:hypothetical protein n=1 Tax=unclassified Colwellia TaxID=196834 RepID=UPI0015F62616|nr:MULTISPECIES: hypothetical protein [unclassified Colwellia]MBA6234065.1 hypothetical protein [Colwellia sp. MB02u-7]MBA6238013.1 hypothetical protein [Colwellia sp. MB02u-11]MBA6300739.1 hypothetical protein [Colwellia sp. MB3u-22]MBA6311362.1 hypothetical protein [Colwellia sp. MB3u-64]